MRKAFRSLTKRDILVLSGISLVLLAVVFGLTGTTRLFGSMTDWVSQHSVIPEYYRQTFYETGELLPDFALSLGGGQNAFYFSYYGLLNPIILLSFLLPFVPMVTYLQVVSVVLLLLSVWLFFIWLRHAEPSGTEGSFSFGAAYLATALFAFAVPLMFHSKRQVMFVHYMPFLLLCLIGVDRFFSKRRGGLLAIGVATLFFTSYYYAIPGCVAVTVYGIYRYATVTKKVTLCDFAKNACTFAVCVLIGTMSAAVLTVPTFVTLLSGREPGTKTGLSFSYGFLGDVNPAGAVCYSGYSMGMTAIAVISLLLFALPKREDGKFRLSAEAVLAIGVLVCAWVPWVRYALNGFLYARAKILVPFIPLAAFLIARMVTKLAAGEISTKRITAVTAVTAMLGVTGYLFRSDFPMVALFTADCAGTLLLICFSFKKKNPIPFAAAVTGLALTVMIAYQFREEPVTRAYAETLYDEARAQELKNVLSNDGGVYRSAVYPEALYGVNRLYGPNYNASGYYASLGNSEYLDLLYKDLNLANPAVNDISFTPQPDILFNTLFGVRYIEADGYVPAGYEQVGSQRGGKGTVYENRSVYPVIFSVDRTFSTETFDSLSPEEREIALLSYAVTEDGGDSYEPLLTDASVPGFTFGGEPNEDGNVHIGKAEKKQYTVTLPDSLSEYVYVVTMKLGSMQPHLTEITVNGVTDVLSGSTNARPNENYELKYVISSAEPCFELTFAVTGEDVTVSVPHFQKVKLDDITALASHIEPAEDIAFTDNRKLSGRITCKSDGVLVATVPYDEGWTAFVDGTEVSLSRVDNGLCGCGIKAGTHTIEMIYRAPGKNAGIGITAVGALGIVLMILLPMLLKRRKRVGNQL